VTKTRVGDAYLFARVVSRWGELVLCPAIDGSQPTTRDFAPDIKAQPGWRLENVRRGRGRRRVAGQRDQGHRV